MATQYLGSHPYCRLCAEGGARYRAAGPALWALPLPVAHRGDFLALGSWIRESLAPRATVWLFLALYGEMRSDGDVDDVTRLSPNGNTEGAAESGVFAAHWQSLVRYATALVGPSDAEDVVMTVVSRSLAGRGLSVLEIPRRTCSRPC